jgi:hypothetical protein
MFNRCFRTVGFDPLAFGKGLGNFDVQSTLGMTFPDIGGLHRGPGTPIVWNTALQYRIARFFWPEVEFNYTYWPNGTDRGKDISCL